MSHKNRYEVFEEKPTKQVKIDIENIDGYFKLTKYKLDRENGSVFDEWLKLGAVEDMTNEEVEYLRGKARPSVKVEYIDVKDNYQRELHVKVHGIELLTLERQVK